MTELSKGDEEIMRLATEETTETPPEAPESDDALELTEDDEVAPPEDGEQEGKKRHKSAKQRIDELTAQRRAAERDLETERTQRAELERRIAALESGHKPDAPELKAPDPNEYEFGEADPKYLAALTDYKVEVKLQERDKASSEKQTEQQQIKARQELGQKLDADWKAMQERGAEKYDDFADKVSDLKVSEPVLAFAIQASPVGDEAAYYLANNPHEAELLQAQIAAGDIIGAAKAFGEIEGANLSEPPVKPTNGNPLDIALYAGRLKAYTAKESGAERRSSKAPEPPEQRARGATGRFEVSDDTTDFKAFEKKYS